MQTDWKVDEELIERFEHAWEESIPQLAQFLPDTTADIYSATLQELVIIDMEFRWKRSRSQDPDATTAMVVPLESYMHLFPENDERIQQRLIEEEFSIRRRFGDQPAVESYKSRFPEFAKILDELDAQHPIDESNSNFTNQFDPDAPLSIEDFRVETKLGTGGMGTVFRATQISLNKPVAVKMLGKVDSGNPESIERFLHEAKSVARLRHPNIVCVHGIGRCDDGSYFLVMDLIDGKDLASYIQHGHLPIDEALGIVEKVARAIDHSHSRGVIHRDLKPSNVMLDADGKPMVTDFGLAKTFGDESAVNPNTIPGLVLGTPQFMAPEQVDPSWGEVSRATDIFGLGGLLYALLTGHGPNSGQTARDVIRNAGSKTPITPIRERRREIPAAIESICRKCLQKRPQDRFASARDVEDALHNIREGRPSKVANDQTIEPKDEYVVSANRRAAVLGVGLAIVATFVASFLWRHFSPDNPSYEPVDLTQVNAEWNLSVFRNKSAKQQASLIDQPDSIYTGDSIRIDVSLTQPAFAYLYWIGSDGSVSKLFPASAQLKQPVSKISIPESNLTGLAVLGDPGTELCVLVLRDQPLKAPNELVAALTPKASIPMLDPATIVMDGALLERTGNFETLIAANQNQDLGTPQEIRDLLGKIDQPSRVLGEEEPLLDSTPAGAAISRWAEEIPSTIGTMKYIAVSHRER